METLQPMAASPWPRGRAGLLAGQCPVCHAWTRGRWCAPCRQQYTVRHTRCSRCALRVPAGVAVCGECLLDPPPFGATTCVADYAFPWDRLIGRFKYAGAHGLAALLADELAQALQPLAPATRPDAVLPLPLSDHRLAERGYDQAWELARHLARRLGLPAWPQALQRRFDTPPQAEAGRAARLRQLSGAFQVDARAAPLLQGRHLALVDDVMTTGATAREAASALLAAGAARVDLWVLARTPSPAGAA